MILVAILNADYEVRNVYTSVMEAQEALLALEEKQKEERYPSKYTLQVYDAAKVINEYRHFKNALINSSNALLNALREDR